MPRINSKYEVEKIKDIILEASIKISLNPDEKNLLLYRAILFDIVKDYTNALNDLNDLLQENPTYIDALYIKADVLLEIGDFNELTILLEKIITIENINIDLINTNFLHFFSFLIKKRKLNITQKVISTIKFNNLKTSYGIKANTTWN